MIDYTEIKILTTHLGSELVADILGDYSLDGVTVDDIEDAIDLTNTHKSWDYADDSIYNKDKTVSVVAYILSSEFDSIFLEIKERIKSLKQNCPFDLGKLEIITKKIDGDMWREKWKENFKPIHIGDKIVIVPSWVKYSPKNGEVPVFIGSNMAFGTGEHETTSMCVEFLQHYVKLNDTVLDVGCGSGILGICASKLGANEVIFTDIDECAVKATKDNVVLNNIKNSTVLLKNLLDDNTVKGNIAVINIVADVLIAFAPYIANNLKQGGIVILSGILKEWLSNVKDAYYKAGFTFLEEKTKGEWSACVFKAGNNL